MKKSSIFMLAASLLLSLLPVQVKAAAPVVASNAQNEAAAKVLTARLYAIHAMDKSELSASEKSELRKEVQGIDRSLRDIGGGIYISVGAIIIILLILLILL